MEAEMCLELPSDFPLNDPSDQLMEVTSLPTQPTDHDPNDPTAFQPIIHPTAQVRQIIIIII